MNSKCFLEVLVVLDVSGPARLSTIWDQAARTHLNKVYLKSLKNTLKTVNNYIERAVILICLHVRTCITVLKVFFNIMQ